MKYRPLLSLLLAAALALQPIAAAAETAAPAAPADAAVQAEQSTAPDSATEPAPQSAEPTTQSAVTASGTCGDNLTWTLEGGTLMIEGSGDMENYYNPNLVPWAQYRDSVTALVLPSGLTSIGDCAFYGCAIRDVSIPEGVICIGNSAFWASAITSLYIPASVASIASATFSACGNLTAFYVSPESKHFAATGGVLFSSDMTTLFCYPAACPDSTYNIPSGITTIAANAFWASGNLTSIFIPASVTTIDSSFFALYNLSNITVDEDNAVLASVDGVLFNKDFTTLYLYPAKKPGTHYVVPESVTTIASRAIRSCSVLSSIELGYNLATIGEEAISDCPNLAQIDIASENASFSSFGGVLFSKDCTTLYLYPPAKSDASYTIPDSVISLEYCSFASNRYIASVISGTGLTTIDRFAFSGCSNLKRITLRNNLGKIGFNAFMSCSSLSNVYYYGAENEWNALAIDAGNELIQNAEIYYINEADICTVTLIQPDNGTIFLSSPILTKGMTVTVGATFNTVGYDIDRVYVDGKPINGRSFTLTGDCTVSISSKRIYQTDIGGVCGETAFWALTSDNTLHIYGSGATYETDYNSRPWAAYTYQVTTVEVASGITHIGAYSFYGFTKLEHVNLPESLTSIGICAFFNSALKGSIDLSYIKTIGDRAFYACRSLSSVILSGNLSTLGYGAFSYCTTLSDIYYIGTQDGWDSVSAGQTFDAAVHIIEPGSFCNVELVHPAEGTLTLTPSLLAKGELVTVGADFNIPGYAITKVYVNGNAIDGFSFTLEGDCTVSVDVAKLFDAIDGGICGNGVYWALTDDYTLHIYGLGAVNSYANGTGQPWQEYSSSIIKIDITEGVTAIGDYAFYGFSNLTEINIPSTLTALGSDLFYHSSHLAKIKVAEGNTSYVVVDDVLFTKDMSELIQYIPLKDTLEYTVPDSVHSIGKWAFDNNRFIREVTIPASVTSIDKCAFHWCENLESFIVDSENPNYRSVDGVLFNASMTMLIKYPVGSSRTFYAIPDGVQTINGAAFQGSSLHHITIPDSATTINDAFATSYSLKRVDGFGSCTQVYGYTFYGCSSLVQSPDLQNVTSIGIWAFSDCSSLPYIILSDKLNYVGYGAFARCDSLKDVYYLGTPDSWARTQISDDNTALTSATIHYLTAAGHCGNGVFWALEWDGVLRIFGSGAVDDFAAGDAPWAEYADQIAAVCVESGVSNVPAGTFSGCKNLVSASVAPGVQADSAFDGCALKMQSQIALLSQNEVRLHLAIAADTAVCAVIYDENGKMLACRCFAAGEAREEDAVLTSALAAGRVKLFTTDRGSAPAAPALTYEIPAEDA